MTRLQDTSCDHQFTDFIVVIETEVEPHNTIIGFEVSIHKRSAQLLNFPPIDSQTRCFLMMAGENNHPTTLTVSIIIN